ncbi:serine O-acetyltransferase [Aliarcobacter butzleri 7h1h]|nr:serine O-acetyltransferase [Aliarcobacter butzleri 7h1h]
MSNFMKNFKADVIFFSKYRQMLNPFSEIEIELNLKEFYIFLKCKSGRFSFLLRLAQASKYRKLRKLLYWFLNLIYSSDIDESASISESIYFPHPFGLVIGGEVSIASECIIFNDVTFGKKYPGFKGKMPKISNKVIIGAGAKILGNVNVSSETVIGANSVLLFDLPDNHTFSGNKIRPGVYWKRDNSL